MLIGLILCLIGGALIETPVLGYLRGEYGIAQIIFGLFCGALFLVPGVIFIVSAVSSRLKAHKKDPYMEELLEALKPGFREAVGSSEADPALLSFREHYSAFLSSGHVEENEPIQQDVTQIFRNILQLQKERLTRLGLTCEQMVRRMQYTDETGISMKRYCDGKYSILDVTEEVAARTVYKKDGQTVFTRQDRDTANYTFVEAAQVGDDRVLCPHCGAETTRDALLDGCDYCGTKFTVEDLDSRIALFAFRPDFKLRYEKYLRLRSRILLWAGLAAAAAVLLGFTVYGIIIFPELLAEAGGGLILTVMAGLFAVIIASPAFIVSFLIINIGYILPAAAVLFFVSRRIAKAVRSLRDAPMLAREREEEIRRTDPNFSIAGFYSGVQNKLSTVIFAENEAQLQAFAEGDLRHFAGKYANVAGMDVIRMEITRYAADAQLQYADVDAVLLLTEYTGKRCRTRREHLHLKLVKAADCKTQVVCAPSVLTCRSCGASLDLLQGKRCPYCGRELELSRYDWVIREMKRDPVAI